jgi:chemotaxis protein methyltransferase CheR
MKDAIQPSSDVTTLTQAEWQSFKDLIYKVTGIALSPAKKALLVARLGRRLRALRLSTLTEYYDRILNRDPGGQELQALVNAITTNKTEFFREPHHFELLEAWLRTPSLELRQARLRGLRIWCAAASTGEEPYTIAAVVRSALSQAEWERTTIFASDLDTNVLEEAAAGRYNACDLENISEHWKERLFTRPQKKGQDEYVIRSDLKTRVQFSQLNLVKSGWTIPKPLDVIFCRNVLIYFDKATQLEVVRRQCRMLAPHGLLFLGHSEGLTGMELQLESVGHTAYRASTTCGQSTRTSIPQTRAVSLSEAAPVRRRPYMISGKKKVRLFLRTGSLVAMSSKLAGQTCMAVLKEDCSTPAGAQQVHSILDAMLHALRQVGGSVSEIQVKTVGVAVEAGRGEEGNGLALQSIVHEWLAREALTLAAKRQVAPDTEVRIEFPTGRIQLRAQVAPNTNAALSASAPTNSSARKAGSA